MSILAESDIADLYRALLPHTDRWLAATRGPEFVTLPALDVPAARMLVGLNQLNSTGVHGDRSLPFKTVLERLQLMTQEQELRGLLDACVARVDAWLANHAGQVELAAQAAETDPSPPVAVARPWHDAERAAGERNMLVGCAVVGLLVNASLAIGMPDLVVEIVDGLLLLLLAMFAMAVLGTGLRARRALTSHWGFKTACGVIALGTVIAVCLVQLSRKAADEKRGEQPSHREARQTKPRTWGPLDVAIPGVIGGLAATWLFGMAVAISGQPEGWRRYFRYRIEPFPALVRSGERTIVLKVVDFGDQNSLHERMTCSLELHQVSEQTAGEDDGAESQAAVTGTHISIRCSIHEDLLTDMNVMEPRRWQLSFEDRCAELYYECILVELEKILAKPDDHKIVIRADNYGAKARRILRRVG